ncbi:MAG TPA: hypothetical protein VLJ61_08165 [Pyrinomonadaceae bacterium]|nr:hypothetical protein [Pyrinomonadaceae bacterium]
MKKKESNERDSEMLDEYDFSGGVRGKHAARYAQGSNVVVLDPDVAEVFPDSESVNKALRVLAEIIQSRSERLRA